VSNLNHIEIDWSLDQFANCISALIWVSRPDGLCTYFNQNWLNFVGREIEQEIGNGWAGHVHPDDFNHCLAIYSKAVEQRQQFKMEYRLKRQDGEYRWILDDGIPRYSESGEFIGFIGTCLDVTDQHAATQIIEDHRDELARIAIRDHLTNAFNRRYLFEIVELEIERHKRYLHQLHMLMIDIDDFKNINDIYGHDIGDEVLISLVEHLEGFVRPFDKICRYGGDEFCIVLSDINSQEAYEIAERIRVGAEEIKLRKNNPKKITLSIGIAGYNETFSGIKEWMRLLDNGLYQAKKEGKNRVYIAELESDATTKYA